MVNSEDFGKRIQKIMDHYDLSASAFADSLVIGRSSISHILSGRNKPSLDFVMKIMHTYPDADFYWLLEGKGTFPPSEKSILRTEKVPNTKPIIHPIPISYDPDTVPKQDLFSHRTQETPDDILTSNSISENKNAPELITTSKEKEVNRIVIFYTDGSFESYQNKKS